MKNKPDISVIIVNWNTCDMLADCIASVEQHADGLALEIIVVDNASSDGSQTMVREKYPHVILIANTDNLGFAKANNQAMAIAKGRYFLLWNSDAFAHSGTFQALLQLAEQEPKVGIIGAQLRNPDGTFQASYTSFPTLKQEFLILTALGRALYGNHYPSQGPAEEQGPQIVDYVEGACLLVRPAAYEIVGGLDDSYFMYAEEVDWCFAMQENGWQVWYQPQAKVTHLGGASSTGRKTNREADLYRSRIQFFDKHYGTQQANQLKLLIYSLTFVKAIIHNSAKFLTQGRYGRPVVSITQLHKILNNPYPSHAQPKSGTGRRQVLLLTQVLPYPPDSGPKVKTWNVLKYLIQHNDVTLVSFVRGDQSAEISHLKEYCRAVYTIPIERGAIRDIWYMLQSFWTHQPFLMVRDDRKEMRDLIDHLATETQFDVVHADQHNMCQYAQRVPKAHKILDAHNALWVLYKRLADTMSLGPKKLLLNRDWRLLKTYEGELCRSFDTVLAVSQEDLTALNEAAQTKLQAKVIPIAVDTDEVGFVAREPTANHILHIGTMYWPPNIDGILWFINEVYPYILEKYPDIKFDVVGSRPPQEILDHHDTNGINVTGYVEDPTPYYQQTGVMIVPLRAGGGMRVKILNALSQGLPMVSTTLGAEGIRVESGKHLLIADTPQAFASAVLKLLDDPALAATLGENGRHLIKTQYDYRVACRPLDTIYG